VISDTEVFIWGRANAQIQSDSPVVISQLEEEGYFQPKAVFSPESILTLYHKRVASVSCGGTHNLASTGTFNCVVS
jgi:hypothetical protein